MLEINGHAVNNNFNKTIYSVVAAISKLFKTTIL